jgi:hypothetical protein
MASLSDKRRWYRYPTPYGHLELLAASQEEADESLSYLLMELMELTQGVTDAFNRWDARRVDKGRKEKKADSYH